MSQITYEQVAKMAEQLSPTEQETLLAHLQSMTKQRALTKDQWETRFRESILKVKVLNDFSARREDWYDDDGR